MKKTGIHIGCEAGGMDDHTHGGAAMSNPSQNKFCNYQTITDYCCLAPGHFGDHQIYKKLMPKSITEEQPKGDALCIRITDYLKNGGLWNPEFMEHDKVRDLLLDCREFLGRRVESPAVGDALHALIEEKP